MSKRTIVGLDVGMVTDHAAFVVVEAEYTGKDYGGAVRYLHQFPIGTPYGTLGHVVGQVIREANLGSIPVIFDLTAVGPTIVPVIREAIRPAWLVPVVLTAGGVAVEDETRTWRIPKRDLITTVQLLLQTERLKIASGLPQATLLLNELRTFRTSLPVSASADTLDWRERPHDDLVLATAMACWWGERNRPRFPDTISFGDKDWFQKALDEIFPPDQRLDINNVCHW